MCKGNKAHKHNGLIFDDCWGRVVAAGVYKDVCVWLRRRLRVKRGNGPCHLQLLLPLPHITQFTQLLPCPILNNLPTFRYEISQFLFQQSLNFSPQYDRQMRCIHTEQLSMSIWSVSQSSVLLLCKTDMLSFSVRTQRICRSHCESRQGNSASPLYQDFQWLLLELRCHPSSDP